MTKTLIIIYCIGFLIAWFGIGKALRDSNIKHFPDEDNDKPSDWAEYIFLPFFLSWAWPILLIISGVSISASYFVRSKKEKK